ncbi:fimbrial protein [Rosenbergiella australiborealis]|uniref:Fimbrial protein n=1 Tax=Rosenbergiella australiborealis TaxID=1544696 RepID=A0ABS5T7X4_9GAMM|nr:fimbrial protein [Rosenbergiella australiborealis]MBT0728471.1 fimbrial protein [Rosenbergiella australiborealis]
MKVIYLYFSGLLLLLVTISAAKCADVTITINGKVVAMPCTVSTPTANIDLGTLESSDFVTAGSASTWKTFTLNLTNCPIGTSAVTATFSGTSDSSASYFSNTGGAQNMAIQLADANGNNITNGGTQTVSVSDSSQSAVFNLEVRAISTQGKATQGSIQSIINVIYTYS